MNKTRALVLAALVAVSSSAFAWQEGGETGIIPVVTPTTPSCPEVYYSGDINDNFLASRAGVVSYNNYQEYLSGVWGGAMTYQEYMKAHPPTGPISCPTSLGGMG